MSLFDQVMSLEQFREHAKSNNIIPLHVKVFANSETPLTIYKKLAMGREGTFLLESAENDGKWSRYSFIGLPAVATLREENGVVYVSLTPSVIKFVVNSYEPPYIPLSREYMEA